MITREEYFKLHGEPAGDTREVMLFNADELLVRVNTLLEYAHEDGVDPGIDQVSGNFVASGYRPAGVNAATANAAAGSKHLTCQAVDIQDVPGRALADWCCRHIQRLVATGLWMEDPRWTGGKTNTDPWVHLQTKSPQSGRRVYIPSLTMPTDPDFFSSRGLAVPG